MGKCLLNFTDKADVVNGKVILKTNELSLYGDYITKTLCKKSYK
jgi:hypothetical protein